MTTFKVPTRDELHPQAQETYDTINNKLGFVPNIYSFIGHSSKGLDAYLSYDAAISIGSFNNKEKEAILLAASEVNGCNYCLSAHTALAKMNGFTEEETIQLRLGNISDERLRALVQLAANITSNRGRADQTLIDKFFKAGYDQKALVDLILLIGSITVTNYLHNLTDVTIDFPLAPSLEETFA